MTKGLELKAAFLAAMAAGFVSCMTSPQTTWSDWRGNEVHSGRSGTVRQVNGMDFWTHGEPDRPFRVVGLMEQGFREHGKKKIELSEQQLVNEARAHGADAVILFESSTELTGYSFGGKFGGGWMRGGVYENRARFVRAVAVQYVNEAKAD